MATRTAAKPAAKPAARKPAVRKVAAKPVVEEEPDLLAGLTDEPVAEDVDESGLDLLDGITEDNGTPWMPWEETDQPAGIQGTVLFRGEVSSDYSDDDVPLLEVQDKSDPELIWSVRGYATALRSQITKTNPQVGDTFAVKYLGEKASRGGKDYHNFKAAVVHR